MLLSCPAPSPPSRRTTGVTQNIRRNTNADIMYSDRCEFAVTWSTGIKQICRQNANAVCRYLHPTQNHPILQQLTPPAQQTPGNSVGMTRNLRRSLHTAGCLLKQTDRPPLEKCSQARANTKAGEYHNIAKKRTRKQTKLWCDLDDQTQDKTRKVSVLCGVQQNARRESNRELLEPRPFTLLKLSISPFGFTFSTPRPLYVRGTSPSPQKNISSTTETPMSSRDMNMRQPIGARKSPRTRFDASLERYSTSIPHCCLVGTGGKRMKISVHGNKKKTPILPTDVSNPRFQFFFDEDEKHIPQPVPYTLEPHPPVLTCFGSFFPSLHIRFNFPSPKRGGSITKISRKRR